MNACTNECMHQGFWLAGDTKNNSAKSFNLQVQASKPPVRHYGSKEVILRALAKNDLLHDTRRYNKNVPSANFVTCLQKHYPTGHNRIYLSTEPLSVSNVSEIQTYGLVKRPYKSKAPSLLSIQYNLENSIRNARTPQPKYREIFLTP